MICAKSLNALMLIAVLGHLDVPNAWAQMPEDTVASVRRAIKPGERIVVTRTDGTEVRGWLVHLTASTIRLMSGSRTDELDTRSVMVIEKRGDSVLNGILIGGAALALPFAAGGGASCSPDCGKVVPGAALGGFAVGGAVGALIDVIRGGRRVVYDARPFQVPARADASGERPPVVSSALDARAPVGGTPAPGVAGVTPVGEPALAATGPTPLLAALNSRIPRRQMVSVTLVTGENLVGRFLNASSDAITLSGRDTPWVVAAETVARVRIRQRRTGAGALIGALVLGGVGVATATGRDGSPGAAVGVAWGGAIWGALIGASIPRYTLVYER